MYGKGVVKHLLKVVAGLEIIQLTARVANLVFQKGDLILKSCRNEFPGHPVQ